MRRSFPRADAYPVQWVIDNEMGPNVLRLTEFLCEAMDLQPGMRVLDLGCGRALSSIFLAKEYEVQVWATDLWISATDNATRINDKGMEDSVFPIHANARDLPFADNFFDAIISIDAFEYFGTDATFLPSIAKYLKPGKQIGVVNAGVLAEIETLPDEWPDDFNSFHSPEWWTRHWQLSRCVDVERAENMENGRELWLDWNKTIGAENDDYIRCKAGENLSLHRIIARKVQK